MSTKLEAQIAVSKIGKYATSESGDTVEVIERPHGGLSVVVADGQRSGHSAKNISNIVVRKAISLLAEGVRDGATARATHDYLRTHRGGRVSAELDIVSVDLDTRTLVLSRNSRCPAWLRTVNEVTWLRSESEAIGIHRNTKPNITELSLCPSMTLIVATDGVWGAGQRHGRAMDMDQFMSQIDGDNLLSAQALADAILNQVLTLDQNRPRDDATVLVVKVKPLAQNSDIRHMNITFPLGR